MSLYKVELIAFSVTLLVQEAAITAAQRYSLPEIAAIFAGVVTVIAALGASVVNVVVALRTGTKIDAQTVKTDELVAKVEQVHTVTNSGLSAVKAELATSNALNTQLRDIITDLKSEREKATLAVALATPVRPLGGRVTDAATDQLAKIENNTAATVEVLKETIEKGGA